jgi:hypothetical protein
VAQRKKSLAQRTPLAGHTVRCWREVKDRKTHQHQKRCVYRRNKSPTAGNYSGEISGYRHGGQHTRNKHDQQFCSSRADISRTEDPECSSLLAFAETTRNSMQLPRKSCCLQFQKESRKSASVRRMLPARTGMSESRCPTAEDSSRGVRHRHRPRFRSSDGRSRRRVLRQQSTIRAANHSIRDPCEWKCQGRPS